MPLCGAETPTERPVSCPTHIFGSKIYPNVVRSAGQRMNGAAKAVR